MDQTTSLAVLTAPKRNSLHWAQGSITWGELIEWLRTPADVKEAGSYLLGTLRRTTVTHKKDAAPCTGMHRTSPAVVSRSALTLDADTPKGDLPAAVARLGCAAIVHTTYSSSPDDLRYRVILPLDREVTPDEYHAAVVTLVKRLGEESFDRGSSEPARYMFKPAAQEPGWFRSWVTEGAPLRADDLLADWDADLSSTPLPTPSRSKRDPYQIDGTVGAFNRSYDDWAELIDAYDLPYEDVDGERWQLVGATSVAGMGVMGPGLVFSHHITDPAYGQACSAFDLVRLHHFSHLDTGHEDAPVNRRPSQAAMLDLASRDARVVADLVGADFTEELGDWKLGLKVQPKSGELVDSIRNWDLICENDPAFTLLHFNEFTLAVETSGDLPWRPLAAGGPTFTATDRADLCLYLERAYHLRPSRTLIDELVNTTAARVRVNPVRDYLETLSWDGTPRVETCLPGVRATTYTRMVARKCMVAAVARVLDPGCKWDHTLVLYGLEGLGKSYWVDRMSQGYSANLGRVGDKDTLLTMQRNWIMTADEGFSLRKAEAEAAKEFLTRTVDVFRAPYDSRPMAYPRHCVIWATTNDEVFLRRQEGNRRFLIVQCETKVNFNQLTDEYVGQVWAEAMTLYQAGERLYLDDRQSTVAAVEREHFIEEDALEGMVSEYLATPVPASWERMSPEARVQWRADFANDLVAPGPGRIERVCTVQLWVEALGRRFGEHNRAHLLDLSNAMKRVPGWAPLPGRHRLAHYGVQQVYGLAGEVDDGSDVI